MEEIIKEAIHNSNAAWELAKTDKDSIIVVDTISELLI